MTANDSIVGGGAFNAGQQRALEKAQQDLKTIEVTLNQRNEQIDMLHVRIEEIETINLQYVKVEDEKKEAGNPLWNNMQATVNNALYQKKYEEAQLMLTEYRKWAEMKFADHYEELMEKGAVINDLKELVEKNNLSIAKIERGELRFEKIEVQKTDFVVKEVMICLDRHIIEASDKARVTVLDREIKKITEQVNRRYKKEIEELEANVLAYQDLLICRDMLIQELEEDLNQGDKFDKKVLMETIDKLKRDVEIKISVIEEYKRKERSDWCNDHDSDDELTKGTCTRDKLQRRVFKKIEHLNEYVRKEVAPEIHAKYAAEIFQMKDSHFSEIDALTKDHQKVLYNLEQTCEANIVSYKVQNTNLLSTNSSQLATIRQKEFKIQKYEQLKNDQARRIDELLADKQKAVYMYQGQEGRFKDTL